MRAYTAQTYRKTDTLRGIKQILVQLTPFTTPDIPLTVREPQQLRNTTPGGTFDVYPVSLLGRWGWLLWKGSKQCAFPFSSSKSFSKPVEFISNNSCEAVWLLLSPSDKLSNNRPRGGCGGSASPWIWRVLSEVRRFTVSMWYQGPLLGSSVLGPWPAVGRGQTIG